MTTVVNYTNNMSHPRRSSARIEVCKQPGDQYVTGSFNFQLERA